MLQREYSRSNKWYDYDSTSSVKSLSDKLIKYELLELHRAIEADLREYNILPNNVNDDHHNGSDTKNIDLHEVVYHI